MQSTAFSLSPSTPVLRSRSLNPNPKCRILSTFSAGKPPAALIRGCVASGGLRAISPRLGGWERAISTSSSARPDLAVRASSVPESADESPTKASELAQTLLLGSLFGLWYLFNIYFNIYNKQVALPFFRFERFLLFEKLISGCVVGYDLIWFGFEKPVFCVIWIFWTY